MYVGKTPNGGIHENWGRRAVFIALALALALATLIPIRASAQGFDIVIPVTTVVWASPGSVTQLAMVSVPDEEQGQTCEVEAHAKNQGSVHPGNDLLVESNGSQVVVPDVEAVSGGSVDGVGQLILGDAIYVNLRMGSDGVFSAGFDVIIDCTPVQTTTTTVVETTTTIAETTTTTVGVEETSTTTAPVETTTTVEVEGSSTSTEPIETTTTSEPEVLGTEVLPFTGSDSGWTFWIAIVLGAFGMLLVAASRRVEE